MADFKYIMQGFQKDINFFEEIKDDNQGIIRITLKYDEKGTRVIDGLKLSLIHI